MSLPNGTPEEIAAAEEAAEAERIAAEEAAAKADGGEGEPAEGDLGDAGKKALDRMKAETKRLREELAEARAAGGDKRGVESIKTKARTATAAAAELREQIAELKAKMEGREAEYAAELKGRQVEAAALGKANERIVRSEIKAAAAGKLHDPKDAFVHLDLSSFAVDDDGNVDEEEIGRALADLIERKPYLGVTQGEPKRFKGAADGGARGSAGKPQVTEQDLKSMTPDQIVAAQKEGRLKDLLGG